MKTPDVLRALLAKTSGVFIRWVMTLDARGKYLRLIGCSVSSGSTPTGRPAAAAASSSGAWTAGTLAGHGGALLGYRTEFHIAPADKVAVIAMTNADDGLAHTYVEKAFQWVVPAIVAAQRKVKPASAEDQWQAYAGRYRSQWGDSQVLIYQGELVIVYPTDPDPLAGMSKLKPHGLHTFCIETSEHFDNNDELAVFALDASGKVVRLTVGNNYAYPVAGW